MNISSEIQHINRMKRILKIYNNWIKSKTNVLDVGCGDGILADYLTHQLNLQMSGCDIEKYTQKPIKFTLIEKIDKLPYKNNSFESALFTDVLHHTTYPNQVKLISEALRVSKKNVIIFELKPTLGAYIEDFSCNKLFHSSMNVPFTFRNKEGWMKIFKEFPVKVNYIDAPRPSFSLVGHYAFCLEK